MKWTAIHWPIWLLLSIGAHAWGFWALAPRAKGPVQNIAVPEGIQSFSAVLVEHVVEPGPKPSIEQTPEKVISTVEDRPDEPHETYQALEKPPLETSVRPETKPQPLAEPVPETMVPPTPPAPDPQPAALAAPAGGHAARGPAAIVNPTPPYPRVAVARGMTGIVWLEVMLDAQGEPEEVLVAESSGHRLLDETARKTVLRSWRFAPSTTASATIRIAFNLDS